MLISLSNSERYSCDLPHVVFVLLRTRHPVQEEVHLGMLDMSLVRADAERVSPSQSTCYPSFCLSGTVLRWEPALPTGNPGWGQNQPSYQQPYQSPHSTGYQPSYDSPPQGY
jgi:hypothetical protein